MESFMDKEMETASSKGQSKGQYNVQPVKSKIKQTWSNLTDDDIASYERGQRDAFLNTVQNKQGVTKEQAEKILASIERQNLKAA
jgi:uncharacterized protein YjbJ (UPF0337 family)